MQSLAIIEDNATVLDYLAQIISEAFPEVELLLFTNGEDALKSISTKNIEMIMEGGEALDDVSRNK